MPNRVRSDSSTSSSNAQTSVAQPASERVDPKLLLAIVATGLMAFIGILTETMTNVLFPTLMEEFHIGTAMVQWLTTGYLLVVSIVTPLSSYLNHRFTLKTSFIAAVVLCIAGLLLASLAVNFPMLMIARILQGAGTGVALPLMFNIILEQSPRSRLGLLMGVGNMVCAIAPALGPTVGGVGVAAIGWRWMFAILIPFLVIAGIVGTMTIRQPRPTEHVHFHWAQLILLIAGFVAFVFALDRFGSAITALTANEHNAIGTLLLAIGLLVVSVAALVWFACASKRSAGPLIHMGALLDRFGPMRPILSTMALAIVGILLMLLLVRPSASVWMICVGYIAYMVGFSMAYPNTMTAGMSVIPASMQPDGNAMFSTFQQLAGAVGTTVMSICLGVAQAGRSITADKAAFAAATQRGGHVAFSVLLVVLLGAFLANIHAFAARRTA